ncbi:MAG: hypothetical protein Q8859_01910 [Bacteroidota bacterium]|nr:hypothetical protein [Bacteroidota bacterium]
MKKLRRIRYLKYRISARHRKGYGIHSPFMFYLVTRIFRNKHPYYAYSELETIYKRLKESNEKCVSEKDGRGIALKKIVRQNDFTLKYGKMLFRMVNYFQPDLMCIHGATGGMNVLYLGMASKHCPLICSGMALSVLGNIEELARQSSLSNVHFAGNLQVEQDGVIQKSLNPLIFINDPGNPDEVYRTVLELLNLKTKKLILIIKGVHNSKVMEEMWNRIKKESGEMDLSLVTADLFVLGMMIIDERLTKQDYIINF